MKRGHDDPYWDATKLEDGTHIYHNTTEVVFVSGGSVGVRLEWENDELTKFALTKPRQLTPDHVLELEAVAAHAASYVRDNMGDRLTGKANHS